MFNPNKTNDKIGMRNTLTSPNCKYEYQFKLTQIGKSVSEREKIGISFGNSFNKLCFIEKDYEDRETDLLKP